MWAGYCAVTAVKGILYRRGFRIFSRYAADLNESGRFSGYSGMVM